MDLFITIPACNEPTLIPTLEALQNCTQPNGNVTVLICFNASETASPEVKAQNELARQEVKYWLAQQPPWFGVETMLDNAMPKKHAGVGLARRMVMNAACEQALDLAQAVLVCLDADCTVAPNYLCAIEATFQADSKLDLVTIYYEHPFEEESDSTLRSGIIQYELFLRYYVEGLRLSGVPYAIHTVGSSMAVRASAYKKFGGMNKRQAGEDFYFIHKIAQAGVHQALNETTVFPGIRYSDRVPFGTGAALREWGEAQSTVRMTYNPKIFQDLGVFIEQIPMLYNLQLEDLDSRLLNHLSQVLQDFLRQNNFATELQEAQKNAASPETFVKRFYQWFDAFRVLKLIHFAHAQYYPAVSIDQACLEVLDGFNPQILLGEVNEKCVELLLKLRQVQRSAKNPSWT